MVDVTIDWLVLIEKDELAASSLICWLIFGCLTGDVLLLDRKFDDGVMDSMFSEFLCSRLIVA